VNEADRANYYDADAEMDALSATMDETFDWGAMEEAFLRNHEAGAKYLAAHATIEEAEALDLLRRLYREG